MTDIGCLLGGYLESFDLGDNVRFCMCETRAAQAYRKPAGTLHSRSGLPDGRAGGN
jgi:hypothetical protein